MTLLRLLWLRLVMLRMSSAAVNWNFKELTQRSLGTKEMESQPCIFKKSYASCLYAVDDRNPALPEGP